MAPAGELAAVGAAALLAGDWAAARAAYAASLDREESVEAASGLSRALWWLGESQASVDASTLAYALARRCDDLEGAVLSAAWLAITYKANFANVAAANGWVGRADRLLHDTEPGSLHAWAWLARAYQLPDLDEAAALTERALRVSRGGGDVDTELVALSQLGRIRVGQGDTADGMAMIDEALAAALAGEPANLDTVVYTCCDMLNACELAMDLERATQWCQVADGFVERYGCPFLYAECRTLYGGVLVAAGRWAEGDRELLAALHVTAGSNPGLHAAALTRLADLRLRQGRLEEAETLLATIDERIDGAAVLSRAALRLARGDEAGAARILEPLTNDASPRITGAATLELLVEVHLAAGRTDDAAAIADRLGALATSGDDDRIAAVAAVAAARVAGARGDIDAAAAGFELARRRWSELGRPYEAARSRSALAEVLADARPLDAVDHARGALAVFDRLGAARDADRAGALLRSLGVPARPGPKGTGDLTAREREVLDLLALGLSNPEIASRLYLSRKTVAHHVSRILVKLGARNRGEAAALVVRHRAGEEVS